MISDFFFSLLVRDLRHLGGAWADLDVDCRNEMTARWRAALKQEQDAELQRHKRAIELLLKVGAYRGSNGELCATLSLETPPSDIADLVKGER